MTDLPQLYHAHHKDYREDLPFWSGLAKQEGDPILELGCGTGRVTLPLARAGYTVFGLDHDPGMLALLRRQLADEPKPLVHLIQGDMTNFSFDTRFPVIICPCNTFSTLDSSARQATLINITHHLTQGGIFAFSVPNPALLATIEPSSEAVIENILDHPVSRNPLQISSQWKRNENRVTVHWHYDHLLPDGQVERHTISTSHSLTPMASYLDELIENGLSIEATYGDFNRTAYTPETPFLIIIARR
jgi:SAM-dependent methyltransferase